MIDLRCIPESTFRDKDCLLQVMSMLGYFPVAASSTAKLPQLLKILEHKNVKGQSALMLKLEVIGYSVALAYYLHMGIPASAPGQSIFRLIQAIISVAVIHYYSQPSVGPMMSIRALLYCAVAPAALASSNICPMFVTALHAKESLVVIDEGLDRISDLPQELIDRILLHLPLRDAVRTSVLSSKWRYKWTTIPELVFDAGCCPGSPPLDDQSFTKKFVDVIDQVLLFHTGAIENFEVMYDELIDVAHWLLHLSSTSSLKEVKLMSSSWQEIGYKMPSALFLCHDLMILRLAYCSLEPPLAFNGFKKMTSLELLEVNISQKKIENLIKGSPLLQTLILTSLSDSISCINIDAPNLQCLKLSGMGLKAVSFGDHRLTSVTVSSYSTTWCGRVQNANNSYLVEFFDHLSQIEELFIGFWFLKFLSLGHVPGILPISCIHLHSVSISMDFCSATEMLAVLCILKSSPNLKELHLRGERFKFQVKGYETGKSLDDCLYSPFSFENLKVVSLTCLPRTGQIVDLIRFLLSYSPALERMEVGYYSEETEKCELLRGCIRFPRASDRAEVVLL